MTGQLARAQRRHHTIKRYFLNHLGTEAEWSAITANPDEFNRVWRKMLNLPASPDPPPRPWRE